VSPASDLDRFGEAQRSAYEDALRELGAGRKSGHWIWFVFPQIAGLGRSETSAYYAISSLEEARAYLAHPVLGTRIRECAGLLLAAPATSVESIFGSLDAMKVRSSMTLFLRAAPGEPVFREVLERHYGGVADAATDRLIAQAGSRRSCRA
jgi:uncharacterized protein (DUF1810 family)